MPVSRRGHGKRQDVHERLQKTVKQLAVDSQAHHRAQRAGTLLPDIAPTDSKSSNEDSPADSAQTRLEIEWKTTDVGDEDAAPRLKLPADIKLEDPGQPKVEVVDQAGESTTVTPRHRPSMHAAEVFHNARN